MVLMVCFLSSCEEEKEYSEPVQVHYIVLKGFGDNVLSETYVYGEYTAYDVTSNGNHHVEIHEKNGRYYVNFDIYTSSTREYIKSVNINSADYDSGDVIDFSAI